LSFEEVQSTVNKSTIQPTIQITIQPIALIVHKAVFYGTRLYWL